MGPSCNGVTKMSKVELDSESVEFIPSRLTCEALSQAAMRYMCARFYAPHDVTTVGRIIESEIRYVPYYRFTGQYEAKWTATFEYRRVEQRQEWQRRRRHITGQAEPHYENVPVMKRYTVWDKNPASGEVVGEFDLRGPAAGGYSEAARRKLLDFVALNPMFTGTDQVPEGPAVMADCTTPPQTVFDGFIKAQANKIIDNAVKQNAQGDRQNNWSFSARFNNVTATIVAVPIGRAVFEYRGQTYKYWASAIDPQRVVADKGPVDKQARLRGILTIMTLGLWQLTPNHRKKAGDAQGADSPGLPDKTSTMPGKADQSNVPPEQPGSPKPQTAAVKSELAQAVAAPGQEARPKSIFWAGLLGLLPFCTTFLFAPVLLEMGNDQVTTVGASVYLLLLLLVIVYAVMRWRGLRAYRRSPQEAKFLGTPRDTRMYLPIMIVGPLIIAVILGLMSSAHTVASSPAKHLEKKSSSHILHRE